MKRIIFNPLFRDEVKFIRTSAESEGEISEMEIIVLVMAGFNDSEIAARQGIAVNTVITHRRNIRKKLNIHSDRELIAYAKKWGLVPHTEPDIQPG